MARGISGHTKPNRGRTNDWLTPPEILRALGPFDLDPCCPPGMPWATAKEQFFHSFQDGLVEPWHRQFCSSRAGFTFTGSMGSGLRQDGRGQAGGQQDCRKVHSAGGVMAWQEVINGGERWAVEAADRLDWFNQLPADSLDLVFGSPPYEAARTYGIDFKLRGQAWVDWMVETYKAALRCCKGLVAFVLEGQTRGRAWSAVPALLMADLHRAGITLRKPPVFHRIGIAGSGGKRADHGGAGGGADWLRNDYEFIVCATRGGKLPWADGTACGHPPKWAPGGEMSNRLTNGARVNQWGHPIDSRATVTEEGGVVRSKGKRPSHRLSRENPKGSLANRDRWGGAGGNRRRQGSGQRELMGRRVVRGTANGDTITSDSYHPPVLANPGNCIEMSLTLPEFVGILAVYGDATKNDPCAVLQDLRRVVDSEALSGWLRGIHATVLGASVLRSALHGEMRQEDARYSLLPGLQIGVRAEAEWSGLLREAVFLEGSGDSQRTCQTTTDQGAHQPLPCQKDQEEGCLREVRDDGKKTTRSSRGRKPVQQRSEESSSSVLLVPSEASSAKGPMLSVRQASEGARVLREAFGKIQKAWRSIVEANISLACSPEGSNLIHCLVGGGVMGHPLCHLNEAPYPLSLCEFFVRSFCPPDGIVGDCFLGSGTTAHAAFLHGRRFIGCDVRQSQVKLARRRLESVTPLMFN